MLRTFGVLINPHKLLPTLSSITTSDQWYTYYEANAEFQLEIPWERGAEITEDEQNAIADSLDSGLDWSSSGT
ncbi:hypothetical protein [Nostoc sp.]|uniref:hypothetical protein n=1 Tax=Nostoc sp. TaxID=1180 RepID=UPI002FF609E9